MIRIKTQWIIAILIIIIGLFAGNLVAGKKGAFKGAVSFDQALQGGEELKYKLSWGVVPAGKGKITITENEENMGVFHIVTTARSNAFVDTFYRVRNRIETFLDLTKGSLGYTKHQKEGTHNRKVDLVFDHNNGQATLIKNGKVKRVITVPNQIHDPLSAIYYLRTIDDWENIPVLDVTDGKKTYQVRINVLSREPLETPLGFFNTIKIEPVIDDMEIIFNKKKSGKLFIWLTDDEKKVPVKMQSELAIGSVQALLTSAKFSRTSK